MKMRDLPLVLAAIFLGCVRLPWLDSTPREEDTSIRFPDFHQRFATAVDEQGRPYELDGVTLRAITIAANDFIPPNARTQQCWEKQEAHRYRVIRQGDIIFVQIHADPAACEQSVIPLDGGAKYAISTDGRILRRLLDGEPEEPSPESQDAGEERAMGTPIPASQVGATWARPASDLPSSWLDGGSPNPSHSTPDADGGSPNAPSPALPPDAN